MELLTIEHKDFTMTIECGKFDGIWSKAVGNVGKENLTSTYSWSEDVVSVKRTTLDDEEIELQNGESAEAAFFDNAEYPIWVEFNDNVKSAQFGSMLQNENDNFSFRRHILAGFLNYGNEIGKSEILIDYKIGEQIKHFRFGFEVLSTKLNYHEHWRQILEDIEQEYRMLSLDFMKRTFHGFSPDTEGDKPDLVWWSIFSKEQLKFIKAAKSIIERPRHRLNGRELFVRADKLKRVPINIENELAEHRKELAHLYRIEEQVQSNDTQENRFLKYALGQITSKYENLEKRIEALNNVAPQKIAEMKEMLKSLKHLNRNPFFRTVGRFKGLTQESLVLQKAVGYSQVYRTWNLLRRAYSLNDGIYRLQTKDIATLYEIWCFIEVSHIVKELLHLDDSEVEQKNRMEMNGVFTWELGKGEHSKILFKKDDVELAELIYNPKHKDKENNVTGIKNFYVPTVPQKPDIVLQLTKNDLQKEIKLTYLFDAKYRIEGRTSNGVDTPPDDAINQMHRYRDAIYYKDYTTSEIKKEVVGGYILFPGDGNKANIEVENFYKSIEKINIGAFPLKPKDKENRELLVDFIKELIDKKSLEILDDSIPQKGLYYTTQPPENGKYMVLTIDNKANTDVDAILNGSAERIVMGQKGMDEKENIQTVRYIAPIKPGSHIEGYYKVNRASWKSINDEKFPIRTEFGVGDWVRLETPAMFGLAKLGYRGVCKTKEEFFKHCEEQAVKE